MLFTFGATEESSQVTKKVKVTVAMLNFHFKKHHSRLFEETNSNLSVDFPCVTKRRGQSPRREHFSEILLKVLFSRC